jgi:hypothetical protein
MIESMSRGAFMELALANRVILRRHDSSDQIATQRRFKVIPANITIKSV